MMFARARRGFEQTSFQRYIESSSRLTCRSSSRTWLNDRGARKIIA